MPGQFEYFEEIIQTFRHVNLTTGVTGWTTTLVQDDIPRTDLAITVTEIGGGLYAAKFTPDGEGVWFRGVYETAAPTVFYDEVYQVLSLADLLGGEGYDPEMHSLISVRSAIQIVRDDQIGIRASYNPNLKGPGRG